MNARLFQCILIFLPFISFAQETVQLSPGHQHVLQAPGINRAAIGNSEVADVRAIPESKQVIVTARKEGSTDLILWFKDGSKKGYTINVSIGGRNVLTEIRTLLNGIEGIEVKTVGANIILDGQVFRGSDLSRIERVLQLYPQIHDFTRVNPEALAFIAGQLESALKKSGIAHVTARGAGNLLFLEGSVSSKSDLERVKMISEGIYPKFSNHVRLGIEVEPLILVDVKLMEVKSNSLGQIGIKWPANVDASGSLSVSGSGLSGALNIGPASVSLRTLVAHGDAKILSNPKLLCRSGTPASFLAGGEIPIRLIGERTAQVIFKEYGVSLQINAKSDESRKVFMDIETVISDLDSASAVEGIPGILEHKVKTAANLRFGDTVVLGGLIEKRARKNVEKLPLLGHIPILGELFKSRDFQKNQSDFLVFLTPLPGGPGMPENAAHLGNMKKSMEKGANDVKLSILD